MNSQQNIQPASHIKSHSYHQLQLSPRQSYGRSKNSNTCHVDPPTSTPTNQFPRIDNFINKTLKIKPKAPNTVCNYFDQQLKLYSSNKITIKSGLLTSRQLSQVLKPQRFKWDTKSAQLNHESRLETKLKLADYFLNERGGIQQKHKVYEELKAQLKSPNNSPTKELQSPKSIRSSGDMLEFLSRIRVHYLKKYKQSTDTPVQSASTSEKPHFFKSVRKEP